MSSILRCEHCNVEVAAGKKNWDQHCQGRKHIENVEKDGKDRVKDPEPARSKTVPYEIALPRSKMVPLAQTEKRQFVTLEHNQVQCLVCEMPISGIENIHQHFKGRRHSDNLDQSKERWSEPNFDDLVKPARSFTTPQTNPQTKEILSLLKIGGPGPPSDAVRTVSAESKPREGTVIELGAQKICIGGAPGQKGPPTSKQLLNQNAQHDDRSRSDEWRNQKYDKRYDDEPKRSKTQPTPAYQSKLDERKTEFVLASNVVIPAKRMNELGGISKESEPLPTYSVTPNTVKKEIIEPRYQTANVYQPIPESHGIPQPRGDIAHPNQPRKIVKRTIALSTPTWIHIERKYELHLYDESKCGVNFKVLNNYKQSRYALIEVITESVDEAVRAISAIRSIATFDKIDGIGYDPLLSYEGPDPESNAQAVYNSTPSLSLEAPSWSGQGVFLQPFSGKVVENESESDESLRHLMSNLGNWIDSN